MLLFSPLLLTLKAKEDGNLSTPGRNSYCLSFSLYLSLSLSISSGSSLLLRLFKLSKLIAVSSFRFLRKL